MRTIWSVVPVLALAALAPSPASARNTISKYHYDTCSCHFGYGNVCQNSAACENEGGHCAGSCRPPANATVTDRRS